MKNQKAITNLYRINKINIIETVQTFELNQFERFEAAKKKKTREPNSYASSNMVDVVNLWEIISIKLLFSS